MKYVIIQGDGMAEGPPGRPELPTPLEEARTPGFDRIAGAGRLGLIRTIPEGMPPGSDVGNLSLFGYDPRRYYTGRSPLEAAAMGVKLSEGDIAFRMNLVSLNGRDGQEVMADYSAGHIDSAAARQLVDSLARQLSDPTFAFFAGISYRHLLVWRGGQEQMRTTPPHDLSLRPVAPHLPEGPGAGELLRIMAASRAIFADHPVNRQRRAAGESPVTQVWLWGQGRATRLTDFRSRFGLMGAAISAVDLVRGVATCAGFDIIPVPGATGFLDTDYAAKAEYGLRALADHDLVFIHIEAPDEAGHMGSREEKIRAIEAIDQKIVSPMLARLPALGPFTMLVTSDHATPVALRTHTAHPVPFALATWRQIEREGGTRKFGEREATRSGLIVEQAHTIIDRMLSPAE